VTAVFFDLNGTLLDIDVLAEPLQTQPGLVRAALEDAVAQAMVLTLCGRHEPFRDLLGAALERRAGGAGRVEAALERLASMPPFPEAAEALDLLASAGFELGVLTQSATAAAETALERAGLRGRLAHVIGCDQVGAFKPDPRPYRLAVERAGAEPDDVWLVAAHWWDVAGAKHAGLRTAYVGRQEPLLFASVPEPDVRALELDEAAARIAGFHVAIPPPVG
jgi:2-haloacid dehalogenase